MNFNQPEGYEHFIGYAESDRQTYGQIRMLKDSLPGMQPEAIKAVLDQFVANSKFENCFPNPGYCEALGFK